MSSLGRKGTDLLKSPHGWARITFLPSAACLPPSLSLFPGCRLSGLLSLEHDSLPLWRHICVYISEIPSIYFLFVFSPLHVGDKCLHLCACTCLYGDKKTNSSIIITQAPYIIFVWDGDSSLPATLSVGLGYLANYLWGSNGLCLPFFCSWNQTCMPPFPAF